MKVSIRFYFLFEIIPHFSLLLLVESALSLFNVDVRFNDLGGYSGLLYDRDRCCAKTKGN
jgi:hypothetical protein